MQIEQFDTGLKGQENIKKINISPEENFKNKQKIRNILNKIVKEGLFGLETNLNDFFSSKLQANCFYPLNEIKGLKNFGDLFWKPLFNAFPDLERREQLVIGGTFKDKVQVGSISTLSGIFKNEWSFWIYS